MPPSGPTRGPPDRDWNRDHVGGGGGIDRGPLGMIDRMPPSGPSLGPPNRDWDRDHAGGGGGIDRVPPGMIDRMPPSGPSMGPPNRDWDRDHSGGGGGIDRGPPGMIDRKPPSGPSMGPPNRDWDREHAGGVGMMDRMLPSGPMRGPPDREWERDQIRDSGGLQSDQMMSSEVGGLGDMERRNHSPLEDHFGRPHEQGGPTCHPTTEEDQFGRQRPPQRSSRGGFNRNQTSGSDLRESGGGGGPGDHNSMLLSGRLVPGSSDSVGYLDREDSPRFLQQQHDPRGSPRQDTGYVGNIAQRFEGPSERNMNRSPLITARLNTIPTPQSATSNNAVSSNQSVFEQSHSGQCHNHTTESATSSNENQRKRRASTPTAINNQASTSDCGANNLDSQPTPKLICPSSPPPAAPSAYALAVSRMVEMNADMEFAYARLMMLDHEHRKVKARLETLEKLQVQEG
ncbi:hypothetical protein ACHAW5_003132 [Stephanodiscus triporus]|uniref:Uncharacterized protein n=1 Tax=Stephanodiscus triporus TaxID=2934178 RepID=A0ABD3N3J6_9STRA